MKIAKLAAQIEHWSEEKIVVSLIITQGVYLRLLSQTLLTCGKPELQQAPFSMRNTGVDCVFVMEEDFTPMQFAAWRHCCFQTEQAYFSMINLGVPRETAQSVLISSFKVECELAGSRAAWKAFLNGPAGVVSSPLKRELKRVFKGKFRRPKGEKTNENIVELAKIAG